MRHTICDLHDLGRGTEGLADPLDVSAIYDVYGGILICDSFEPMVSALERLIQLVDEADGVEPVQL
jgi:hypothetical protein